MQEKSYWKPLLKTSGRNTLSFFGWNIGTLTYTAFSLLATIGAYFWFEGMEAVNEQFIAVIFSLVIPNIAGIATLMGINILRTSKRMVIERDQRITQLEKLLYPPKALSVFFEPSDSNCFEFYDDNQLFIEHYRIKVINNGKTDLSNVKVILKRCLKIDTQGEFVLGIRPDILEPLCENHDGCFELSAKTEKYVNVFDHYYGQHCHPDEEGLLFIQFVKDVKYACSSIPRNADNIKFRLELVATADNTAQVESTLEVATNKQGIPTIKLVNEAS